MARTGRAGEHRRAVEGAAVEDESTESYDGLHAKAVSTGFPEEAAPCRAKAEQLRVKHAWRRRRTDRNAPLDRAR
jgi:hypothetical protein